MKLDTATYLRLLGRLFARWRGDDTHVSDVWLREQERRDQRVEFHSQALRWPLNKIINEHAGFNTKRLRKRHDVA